MRKSKHVLSKAGVQFTDKQKGVIKSLVEIRKEGEIQEVILIELDKQLAAALYGDSTGDISTTPPCETVLLATEKQFRAIKSDGKAEDMSKTNWVASINKPTNDNPPCETVLLATEKHFRKFAAEVVAAIEAHELALKTEAAIHVHELDDIWIEAKRIIDEFS